VAHLEAGALMPFIIDPGEADVEIPGFTRGRFLGKGSFATVTLYTREVDQKNFAVKTFSKKRLMRQKRGPRRNALQDIQGEIAIMKKLNHPNLVKLEMVLDIPEEDKMLLVMEHLSGGTSMGGSMRNEPALPEDTARSYFRDALCGLEYLHTNNILHLDLKPENMLLDHRGTLKLVDFGVSKLIDGEGDAITGSVGTPMFWAPECCHTGRSYSGIAADVWALGVTLYQWTTGTVPFIAADHGELRDRILNQKIEIPAWAGPDLRDLLACILCKDPDRRMTIAACKAHGWVVGEEGELPRRDRAADRVDVSSEEIRMAYISMGTLVKVVSKMKGLLRKKVKRYLGREVERRPPQHQPFTDVTTKQAKEKLIESLSVWTKCAMEPFILPTELGY